MFDVCARFVVMCCGLPCWQRLLGRLNGSPSNQYNIQYPKTIQVNPIPAILCIFSHQRCKSWRGTIHESGPMRLCSGRGHMYSFNLWCNISFCTCLLIKISSPQGLQGPFPTAAVGSQEMCLFSKLSAPLQKVNSWELPDYHYLLGFGTLGFL